MTEPRREVEGDARGAAPALSPRTGLPLAAVALAALALWWGARPSDAWIVLESVDAERDDGESLDAGDRFAFATLITPGIGSADVQLGGSLRVLAPPGTRVELPPGPGRWFGRSRVLRVDEGRILVTTGDRPPDFDFVVMSPETRTRAAAATFSVERNSLGTRICLWKGRIETESLDGERVLGVPEGMRIQFFSVDMEPEAGPLTVEEETRLAALHAAGTASAAAAAGIAPR